MAEEISGFVSKMDPLSPCHGKGGPLSKAADGCSAIVLVAGNQLGKAWSRTAAGALKGSMSGPRQPAQKNESCEDELES